MDNFEMTRQEPKIIRDPEEVLREALLGLLQYVQGTEQLMNRPEVHPDATRNQDTSLLRAQLPLTSTHTLASDAPWLLET